MSENNPGIIITETDVETVPEYISPRIRTYTSEEILDQIGPALTCSGQPCGID